MKRALAVVLLIVLYGAVVSTGILPNPPFAGLTELLTFISSERFLDILWKDVTSTVGITFCSWLIGSILGVFVGTLVALASRKAGIAIGMLEFLRSIPSVMWIPFGIVIVGLGARSALAIAGFVVFLFMASETAYSGHMFVRARRVHLQRLGLSFWKRIIAAHLYEILSVAVPSAQVAVTISLIVVVIAEMQAGSNAGLGARLISFQASQRGDAMLSIVIVAGLIGMLLNAAVRYLQHVLVPWAEESDSI
jgi:ABC-type nitrate/sulfonate/bicarbonate transport system permease component